MPKMHSKHWVLSTMRFDEHSAGRSELVKKARAFARQKHEGQKRKGGLPYFLHPQRVAALVAKYKRSHKLAELIAAAYAHDTVEDTPTPLDEIQDLFGGLVASLVGELTSDPAEIERMGKAEYLASKMENMSDWALVVKLADRASNTEDLRQSSPDFARRYAHETEHILQHLESTRALTNAQKALIKLIKKNLARL